MDIRTLFERLEGRFEGAGNLAIRCPLSAFRGRGDNQTGRGDSLDLSSGLRPAPFRSGMKEGAQNFLCPLEGNAAKQQRVYEVNHVNETLLLFHAARRLARLGNSMRNCHLRKGPDVTCFAAASYAAGCVEVGDFGAALVMTGGPLRGPGSKGHKVQRVQRLAAWPQYAGPFQGKESGERYIAMVSSVWWKIHFTKVRHAALL